VLVLCTSWSVVPYIYIFIYIYIYIYIYDMWWTFYIGLLPHQYHKSQLSFDVLVLCRSWSVVPYIYIYVSGSNVTADCQCIFMLENLFFLQSIHLELTTLTLNSALLEWYSNFVLSAYPRMNLILTTTFPTIRTISNREVRT